MTKAVFALMISVFCMVSRAEPVGRLFFTPEQRLLFDLESRSAANLTLHDRMRLDGAVSRNAGDTYWINGRPFAHDPALGRVMNLRVGEAIDTRTRQTTDIVPDGSITKRRER